CKQTQRHGEESMLTDQKDRAQGVEYEKLAEPQQLAVLKELFGANRAGHDERGLHVWNDGRRGYVPAPTTREALILALPERTPEESDGMSASPPPIEDLSDWDDDEDEAVDAAEIERLAAQAEEIEWPDPASLPVPDELRPEKTPRRSPRVDDVLADGVKPGW